MKSKNNYINFNEFVPFAPSNTEEVIRINHKSKDCEGNSNSLKIERKRDGTILAFCFRCGKRGCYMENKQRLRQSNTTLNSTGSCYSGNSTRFSLPRDLESQSYKWPKQAIDWLRKYNLTDKEIKNNGIVYYNKFNRLLFPIYWKGNLEGYVTRQIFKDNYPKYLTYRNKDGNLIGKYINKNTDRIVIVEDVISAIKCSRYISSYAMLGSYISDEMKNYITNNYEYYIIYLDNDNLNIKQIQNKLYNYFNLFNNTKLIRSNKDPKELTDYELQQVLL